MPEACQEHARSVPELQYPVLQMPVWFRLCMEMALPRQELMLMSVAMARTHRSHELTYVEICESDRAAFVVLGSELGGRLSHDALRNITTYYGVLRRTAKYHDVLPNSLACHEIL
jgi:hypothetical protein